VSVLTVPAVVLARLVPTEAVARNEPAPDLARA